MTQPTLSRNVPSRLSAHNCCDYRRCFSPLEFPIAVAGPADGHPQGLEKGEEEGLAGDDRQFVEALGVQWQGRPMVKFLPPGLEKQLTTVELEYARSHGRSSVSEIAQTISRSEKSSGGSRILGINQRCREL